MDEIKITIKRENWKVEHPVELIKAFVCLDNSYVDYDTQSPKEYEDACKCVNQGMGGRIPISNLRISLDNLEKEIPCDSLKALFNGYNREKILEVLKRFKELRSKDEIGSIAVTTFTKIVHRLSEGNFPLVDSLIAQMYKPEENIEDDNKKIEVLGLIMKDFEKSKEQLEKLSHCLEKIEIYLTALRIFDILLWVKAKIFQGSKKPLESLFFKKG